MQELEQLSHEITDAIRTRNRPALEAVLVADFVQIDERGHRLGKEAFITAVETGEFQIEELRFESLSVEQFDETGVVRGVQGARVRLPTGERVEGRTAFTDVFVRAADGWRLRLATSAELGQGGMA
jgi:ketosteroid isomerase-like protein